MNNKRKFYYGTNQPKRKKRRKFNKYNTLFEANKLLQQQNDTLKEENNKLIKETDECTKEINIHKKEANKWKSQFHKLHGQLTQITNHGNNDNNINTNSVDTKPPHSPSTATLSNNYNKRRRPNFGQQASIVNKPRMKAIANNTKSTVADASDTTYDSIRDRLYEMGYDRNKVLNRIASYNGSDETPQSVFNALINTFTPDVIANKYNLRKKTKSIESSDSDTDSDYMSDNDNESSNEESMHNEQKNKKNDNKNGNNKNNNNKKLPLVSNCGEYVDFERSFHVSVHCHICKKHFDHYDKYCNDMRQHYETDPNKTWRQCDFGCKVDPEKPLFADPSVFLSHIAKHTKDKPYKCDVIVNGKKCESTSGQRKNIHGHWKLHFNKMLTQTKRRKASKKSKPKRTVRRKKNIKQNKRDYKKAKKRPRAHFVTDPNFEANYYVSVNCHLCEKHFADIHKYKNHMRVHYDADPVKTWLKCDVCSRDDSEVVFRNYTGFICHIASHTQSYPFKCSECEFGAGTKSNLKKHWNSKHNKNRIGYSKMYESASDSENESCADSSSYGQSSSFYASSSRSESESEFVMLSEAEIENIEFENSYLVSVDCHICKKNFGDIQKYRHHIKAHYQNDRNRKWLECDFGCMGSGKERRRPMVLSTATNFILHIGSHTKQKPFRCNWKMENGVRCARSMTQIFNLRKHWESNHLKQRLKDVRKNINIEKKKKKKNVKNRCRKIFQCNDSDSSSNSTFSA